MSAALAATPGDPSVKSDDARLLDAIDVAPQNAEVLLSSGRRYSMSAEGDTDRLTVRSRNGRLLLCVIVTEHGPVLAFEGAELQVRGTRSLLLEADTVAVRARTLRTQVDGDVSEEIGGGRHTRVAAADRLEAASIETQASEGSVQLRAAGRIALDGEHVGLNDNPCPEPFGWSELARRYGHGEALR